jgi:hypothetical protein
MIVPLYNILINHVENIISNENIQEIDNENNSEACKDEEKWDQVIKEAAKKSKVKLLEYYNKTHDIYLISTILDSRLKFQYYKNQN